MESLCLPLRALASTGTMAWDVCPPSGPAALQGSPPKLDFADDFDYYTIHYKVG
jgi:rRNA maturation protein Nop10